jgi:hypothetical protein
MPPNCRRKALMSECSLHYRRSYLDTAKDAWPSQDGTFVGLYHHWHWGSSGVRAQAPRAEYYSRSALDGTSGSAVSSIQRS